MTTEQLTSLLTFSLAAMKTGSNIAAAAATGIRHDAHNPQLRAVLDQGTKTAQQWATRIDRALAELGGAAAPVNHIMQAHYEVDQRLRSFAQDDDTRDLGIIASGQRALHYWLAFFETGRTYAVRAGLDQIAQEMQASRDKAQLANEQHARVAEQILSA
ncbi:hypothetical protein A0257_21290 [Hymenobacter psoromatis]|nr:hypothetical protein A0257_21290 [Hymenobacter psoromatis]